MSQKIKLHRSMMTMAAMAIVVAGTTACSSMKVSTDSFVHVLDTQNELLSRLREERMAEPVSEKVRADRDLQTAEKSLNEAVFAVEHSNKVLKYILKKEDEE